MSDWVIALISGMSGALFALLLQTVASLLSKRKRRDFLLRQLKQEIALAQAIIERHSSDDLVVSNLITLPTPVTQTLITGDALHAVKDFELIRALYRYWAFSAGYNRSVFLGGNTENTMPTLISQLASEILDSPSMR